LGKQRLKYETEKIKMSHESYKGGGEEQNKFEPEKYRKERRNGECNEQN
jgi:hypothetical protein